MSDVDVSVQGPASSPSGMFASALCAVDGTDQSIAAIEHAGALVGPSGHLTLLLCTAFRHESGLRGPEIVAAQASEIVRGQRLLPQPPA